MIQSIQSFKFLIVIAAVLIHGVWNIAVASPSARLLLASTGTAIDDTVITTKIKAAYLRDPVVGVLEIHVDTIRGIVYLSGLANTEAEKERAATLAQSIEGVLEVKNDIRVKEAPSSE
ncbi:BON domain-containing protein [Methylocaldum sp.]|uniref:BON domain-containing protein n=1 Tax=Methylocaldum sp. TaxID=1969727 RepID=UPI002D5A018F|nr:BON domain-containing protein [Methylocaldum sp.]HYE33811.1 BON domain-containing protein [Methylocaldum sp.]